jgi:hypothetical protein
MTSKPRRVIHLVAVMLAAVAVGGTVFYYIGPSPKEATQGAPTARPGGRQFR